MSTRTLIVVVASMISFLLAAKAHGRQLRLERELEGYHHVVFGGTNPPFVEALWGADRVRFWSIAAGMAVGVLGLFALTRLRGWSWPFLEGGGGSAAWAAVWGAMVMAFLTCGLWSLLRLMRAISEKGAAVDSEWTRAVLQGSAGWLSAAAVAMALVVFASLRRA
ncbi:MAG: hypothetical protein JXB05_01630 [Myxococcaceae bacterium]|nr:hypothetical protein [Myxococcaceae bacterium]